MQLHTKTLVTAIVTVGLFTSLAQAQHADDLQPFYDAGQIKVMPGAEGFLYEGHFPTSGLFARFTSDPGFDSESSFGLGLLPNDILSYNVVDNLFFWNGATMDFVDPGTTTITIDNTIGPNTIIGSATGVIAPGGIIGQANSSGDFHSHVDYTLSSDADFGAYGLRVELETDRTGIENSDALWLVFNYGLPELEFEDSAVPAFAAVPEPSSIALGVLGCALLGLRTMFRRKNVG